MVERVSQANWPAMRVRNIVKEFENQRERQFMPLSNPPPKRMSREKGLEWLAKTAGISVVDLKLMRPAPFVQQYVLGSREEQARIRAVGIVHGITSSAMYGHESKDCASDWEIQFAREELAATAPGAPAPVSRTAPRMTPEDSAAIPFVGLEDDVCISSGTGSAPAVEYRHDLFEPPIVVPRLAVSSSPSVEDAALILAGMSEAGPGGVKWPAPL